MGPIVEFRMRSPEMGLEPTFEAMPDVRVEVIRIVATDPERPHVLFWVDCADRAAFEDAMRADPTVADSEDYGEGDGQALYRIQVSDEAGVVTYPQGVEMGLHPLRTVWEDGWWHLQVRFPDRERLGDVREWCEANDVEFVLDCLYTDEEGDAEDSGLTEEQRQVLRTALELGYFEIPRQASMADVAAALDVSSQAVSERLRRGYRQLVAEHVG